MLKIVLSFITIFFIIERVKMKKKVNKNGIKSHYLVGVAWASVWFTSLDGT